MVLADIESATHLVDNATDPFMTAYERVTVQCTSALCTEQCPMTPVPDSHIYQSKIRCLRLNVE